MKSSESDSYADDDDCNSQFDEVQQIKIAMVRINYYSECKKTKIFLSIHTKYKISAIRERRKLERKLSPKSYSNILIDQLQTKVS